MHITELAAVGSSGTGGGASGDIKAKHGAEVAVEVSFALFSEKSATQTSQTSLPPSQF